MKKILGIVLFALCLQLTCLPVPAEAVSELKKIRVAYLQNDLHHLPLWVAMEKGFFREEGIDVGTPLTFRAGPEVMTAVASGALDFAYVGESPATVAFSRGNRLFRVIAQVNIQGSAIVVGSGAAAKSVAELNRGCVAVPGNGSVQDFLLRKAMKAAGLAPTDVRVITLPPSEMSMALGKGQINAFVAWQPYPARAVVRGEGLVLADSSEIWNGHPCCCLIATEAMISDGTAKAVAAAHRKSVEYIQKNPDEAKAVAAKYTGMDSETIAEAFSRVQYRFEPAVEEEKEYVRFLNDIGFISEKDADAFAKAFIHPVLK